jgi:hypothetical protein
MAGTLWEAGLACHSRASVFTPGFRGVRVAHLFNFLCYVFCFVCLRPVCPFLIAPSVFSNVYLKLMDTTNVLKIL